MNLSNILKDMISQTFGTGLFDEVTEILSIDPQSKFPDAWSLIENMHTSVIMPVALSFILIHLLTGIMEKASNDNVSPQHFLFLGIKFLAAKYFVENCLELSVTVIQGGITMLNGLSGVVNSSAGFDQILWKIITGKDWSEDTGFWESIGYMIYILIPWLGSLILMLILKAMAYTRVVTLFLRIAFAPLGMSDFFTEGIHGAGWRYFKNTFAVAIQGVVMFAVVSICSYIMKDVIDATAISGWSYLKFNATYFAIGVCCVGLLGKSQQMAREIMGTG